MLKLLIRNTVILLPLLLLGCATRSQTLDEGPEIELYGEIHGTNEIPAYFETEVRHKLKSYKKLDVGVELTQSEISSACAAIAGNHDTSPTKLGWYGPVQDGRFSQSMAQLVCNLTKIRRVNLFPMISDNDSALRDKMISEAIISRRQSDNKIIALMGNFHSRNSDARAAGLVRASGLDAITYVFDARISSRAWICQGPGTDCGSTDIGARFCSSDEELTVGGVIVKNVPGGRWDKCVSLERFTPSLPIATN